MDLSGHVVGPAAGRAPRHALDRNRRELWEGLYVPTLSSVAH